VDLNGFLLLWDGPSNLTPFGSLTSPGLSRYRKLLCLSTLESVVVRELQNNKS
jgi:hypothetical protein